MAGLLADVVQLVPVDALRFGYRIWTEQETRLVVKLQTLDQSTGVLEQAAFSELQLDAAGQYGQTAGHDGQHGGLPDQKARTGQDHGGAGGLALQGAGGRLQTHELATNV